MTEQQMTETKLALVQALHAAGAPIPVISKTARVVDALRESTRTAQKLSRWAVGAACAAVVVSAVRMVV